MIQNRPIDLLADLDDKYVAYRKAFEAMREALICISRGLTNGQKERRETFQTIARAALALADKVSK